MKLYHGTRLDVKERILENGIEPSIAENPNAMINEEGIFAFNNIEDAKSYAYDLCESRGIAIFSFEIDENEVVIDPEYSGNAYFVPTAYAIEYITLEYEQKY
jgi:hypothetical protein